MIDYGVPLTPNRQETKEFDYLVFILRGEPFHNGHKKVIDNALELAHHVIILIGSAYESRSFRNPWTYDEREQMILNTYRMSRTFNRDFHRLHVRPLVDTLYVNNAWLENTQRVVNETIHEVMMQGVEMYQPRIGLIGHSKDHTSFYLDLFPQWGSVNVPGYDDERLLDATWIRNLYFTEDANSQTMNLVLPAVTPVGTSDFLKTFHGTPEYDWVYGEHEFAENYKRPYQNLPHEVAHQTVDAVVIQSGHVLIIERRARPGKGQLALPGGFVKKNKGVKQTMLEELTEETGLGLKVAERVLTGSIKKFWVFDDPHRDPRGRVYSNTFLISLEPRSKLPKVRGGDDAKRAMWIPLADLDRTQFFCDHYHIIQKMKAGV